ncbi:MAG: hypothetical protein ABIU54_10430, partial [Candidatus Eisenbacteria bacterium]
VVGPPALVRGETHAFTAEVLGVGPMIYDWWRTFERLPRLRERVGSGPSLILRADAAFTVECRITDALGRRATQVRPISLLDLTVSAPTRVSPGEAVLLRAVSNTPLTDFEFTWRAIPYCGATLCGTAPETLGTAPELSVSFSTDVLIELSGTTSWGSRIIAGQRVNVLWPRAAVLGPAKVSPRESATFVADVGVVGPFFVQWWSRDIGTGIRTAVGTGPWLELRQASDYDVVVRVRDALGREQEAIHRVIVSDVVGLGEQEPRFALETATIGKGSREVRFQLPQAAFARLVVLDVSGREITRLWDGVHGVGQERLTWDPAGARAGIYFVRLEALGRAITRRLVWLAE